MRQRHPDATSSPQDSNRRLATSRSSRRAAHRSTGAGRSRKTGLRSIPEGGRQGFLDCGFPAENAIKARPFLNPELSELVALAGRKKKGMAIRVGSGSKENLKGGHGAELARGGASSELLRELVAHLRQHRTQLREEWVSSITATRLLTAMTKEEIFAEATSVYDSYVEALETETFEALQAYARNLSERIIPRGVETHEVVGIVLLLRDVLARSLFAKYQADFEKLNRILDAYEPAANRIANTVAVGFVQERERVIRQQQEAIRELSTPVLQVRERLLILPIIGVIDPQRARQLTEQLLRGIRTNRAKVVVIDITGVAAMDATVANHLVQTVEASRLLGATVIVTGLSPEIAQTLVTIGVDLGKMNTVGDLQGGIEQAERLLGYKVIPEAGPR
jgi:rsbT co-antagonist protein RsbR